jgi:hypothetical protein
MQGTSTLSVWLSASIVKWLMWIKVMVTFWNFSSSRTIHYQQNTFISMEGWSYAVVYPGILFRGGSTNSV